jgi:hypothetical protein
MEKLLHHFYDPFPEVKYFQLASFQKEANLKPKNGNKKLIITSKWD